MTEKAKAKNAEQKIVVAKDKDDLIKLIKAAIKKNGENCDLNFIDVSKVTEMNELFMESKFNGDISKWNVPKVTTMEAMFADSEFSGNISKWKVSKDANMFKLFVGSPLECDPPKWYKE